MRPLRVPTAVWSLAAVLAASAEPSARPAIDVAGDWRFSLDANDIGLAEGWWARTLPGTVRLPGSLTVQRIGDPVTVETKWTGRIIDKSFFTAPEYEPYRRPGQVKVPF